MLRFALVAVILLTACSKGASSPAPTAASVAPVAPLSGRVQRHTGSLSAVKPQKDIRFPQGFRKLRWGDTLAKVQASYPSQKFENMTGMFAIDALTTSWEHEGDLASFLFVDDQTETPGKRLFNPRDYLLPTDKYIKERITQSDSNKRYGQDTYFGRKFFYKTKSGARIVCVLPFLNDQQDTLATDDISIYPQFSTICSLLDKLVSSRFANAVTPLISAHANAAIPLHLGTKVLRELARALMQEV